MHRVRTLKDLQPGDAIRRHAKPPIAVVRTEVDEPFAVDDTCTHRDAFPAWAVEPGQAPNPTMDCHV